MLLDDKTKSCIIEKFETAAKEFNFHFVAPYYMGENNEFCFFGHLFKEDPQKGVIIDITYEFEGSDAEKFKYCRANKRFYSSLNITPLLGEYDRDYFSYFLLENWKDEF